MRIVLGVPLRDVVAIYCRVHAGAAVGTDKFNHELIWLLAIGMNNLRSRRLVSFYGSQQGDSETGKVYT